MKLPRADVATLYTSSTLFTVFTYPHNKLEDVDSKVSCIILAWRIVVIFRSFCSKQWIFKILLISTSAAQRVVVVYCALCTVWLGLFVWLTCWRARTSAAYCQIGYNFRATAAHKHTLARSHRHRQAKQAWTFMPAVVGCWLSIECLRSS